MAWWQTQLTFQGDTLISETFNAVGLDGIQFSADPTIALAGEPFSVVVVSGYALYGVLRGYYALGIAHMRVDRERGQGYMSERSQAHQEPSSSLSAAQKQVVAEWLRTFNPSAWETSTESFKHSLL